MTSTNTSTTAAERRVVILETLKSANTPVSATQFGKQFGVSRQVIVQDVALLRAEGATIESTHRGYVLAQPASTQGAVRVFKCRHTVEEIPVELYAMVDLGAVVVNVFISHRAYGTVQAQMNIRNRAEADAFVAKLTSETSQPLMIATDGFHYHTVRAETEAVLDAVEHRLNQLGFLAPLRPHESEEIRGQL